MNPCLDFGTAPLELLPERAAWCARSATLFVADLHWGKHASFRAHGLALPEGDLEAELATLSKLIEARDAARVVVLGDLIHDHHALAPVVTARIEAWRARHRRMQLVLVPGNHDRHLRDLPSRWDVDIAREPLRIEGRSCVHEPPRRARTPTLAGHLHPTVRLTHGRETLRLPAYRLAGHVLTLPAFTKFSNGVPDKPGPGVQMFAVTDSSVVAV